MFKKYRIYFYYFLLAFLPLFKGCDAYSFGFPFPFFDIPPIFDPPANFVYGAGFFAANVLLLSLFVRFILKNPQRFERLAAFTYAIPASFSIFVVVFILGHFADMELLENIFYCIPAQLFFWLFGLMSLLSRHPSELNLIDKVNVSIIFYAPSRLWFIAVTMALMPAVGWVRRRWALEPQARVFAPWARKCFFPLLVLQILCLLITGYLSVWGQGAVAGARGASAVLLPLGVISVIISVILIVQKETIWRGVVLFLASVFLLLSAPIAGKRVRLPYIRKPFEIIHDALKARQERAQQERERQERMAQRVEAETRESAEHRKVAEAYNKALDERRRQEEQEEPRRRYDLARALFERPQKVLRLEGEDLVLDNGLVIKFVHLDTQKNLYNPRLDRRALFDFVQKNIIDKGIGVTVDIGSYEFFERSPQGFTVVSPQRMVGFVYAWVYVEGELINDKFIQGREAPQALSPGLRPEARVTTARSVTTHYQAGGRVVQLSDQETQKIGEKIFRNECALKEECLVHWNEGEEFLSLGIGHFIWYPQGRRGPFEETFPRFLEFAKIRREPLPPWLDAPVAPDCPWASREEFLSQQADPRLVELRVFLGRTKALQAGFIIENVMRALTLLTQSAPENARARINGHIDRLAATPQGVYILADYVNFKGLGLSPSETYQGQGWGLFQVLDGMAETQDEGQLIKEFVRSADEVLTRRVKNAPPERGEDRWLAGWRNRINSYLEP